MKICVQCGERNPDRARFCMMCSNPLGRTIAADRRKVVTILFADMKGSTQLGERLEPEALRGVMTRFYAVARGILERHGGTVEKFIGDAVMCVFGVPRVSEDDAMKAVRAALDFRDAVEVMNAELIELYGSGVQIRTGVNTGDVVAGDPASGDSYVSGDAVNVAARFEQVAEPGQILIGAATHALVSEQVDVEAVEPLTLKGKSEPVPAFRLIAVREGESRRLVAPLIGRDDERAQLLDVVRESIAADVPRVAVVTGPPGSGKTRLLEDVRFALEGEAHVVAVRCAAGPEGEPLPQAIRGALEAMDDGSAVRAAEELLAGREQAQVVADAVARVLDGSADAEAAAWVAQQIFSRSADGRPLVLAVDDGHVTETSAIDELRSGVLGSAGAVSLLIGARPELLDDVDRRTHPDLRILELAPLAAAAAAQIVDSLLGGSVDAGLRARIVDAAGGNPLFLSETLRMLLEDGSIHRVAGGSWQPTREIEYLEIPATVRAVLAARIDRLPDGERAVVDAAAILGSPFELDAVRALVGDDADVARAIAELDRRELVAEVRDRTDTFRLRQALLADVASDLMTREMGATLHERAADHLERMSGHGAAAADHLERALTLRRELGSMIEPALVARTASALLSAGEERLERGDGDGASGFLARLDAVHGFLEPWKKGERRRAADLAYRLGAWDVVISLLDGSEELDATQAEHLGVALTRRDRDEPERLSRGRALLERAVELGADPNAAAALAGTWKGIDDRRAQELYLQAHQLDPAQAYALGNLLEYEIAMNGSWAAVDARRDAILAAAERCAEQGAAGENVPWTWFDLGKFRLLLGDIDGALMAYATAIGRSVAAFQIATSQASIDRLAPFAGTHAGIEESRRLLALGAAVRFDAGSGEAVRASSTPGAWPLAPPIAILAGGSSDEVDEHVRGYTDVMREAMRGWEGTIVSGGTRQGVSALAGDLGETGARVIGYLPATVPDGVAIDDDPRRYAELRRSDGATFGAREPIRYWSDVVASGIEPGSVRLIALAGGTISAFEYRLAVALGAKVGAIRGSGDAATQLLRGSTWSASGRVEELEPDPASIRAFLNSRAEQR